MASDNGSSGDAGNGNRPRRSSITQSTLSNLFRGNTYSGGPSFPINQSNSAANDRRRLSITTLGLSGTSPGNSVPYTMRRGSVSTNSDSIDESAIDDDDAAPSNAKTAPTTPFVRRMSFGGTAMRNYRPNGSPGNDQQQGFNWSEQLRSRAESSVSGARPSFSFASGSPPRGSVQHDRAKSISDMPQPPAQASAATAKPERPKPDAFQERILKGDFYMD
jgi:hypothetical protein